MENLYYDLHLHSCLSPCGDADMTPYNLVNMAAINGLEVIALTDHNTARNCPAALRAGEEAGLLVLPGMELTTAEEIHVVCLFPELDAALAFSDYVYACLPDIENMPGIFGEQILMDAADREVGRLEKLLINATSIPVTGVRSLVESYGGFCYPAHIDRSSNSILANLGEIPPECGFTAVEISKTGDDAALMAAHADLKTMRRLHSSDAHYLPDIADPVHRLRLAERTPAAVIAALKEETIL